MENSYYAMVGSLYVSSVFEGIGEVVLTTKRKEAHNINKETDVGFLKANLNDVTFYKVQVTTEEVTDPDFEFNF